jgi:8-oxo-dGTP pyrophosphatase MutT (NUDIX family)
MPHIHEKIDFTVDVFIVYKDKVLLRMHEKHHRWLVPGGHIELGEDPIEAAIREVKEEVGLDIIISPGKVPPPDDFIKPIPTPRHMGRHRVNEAHEHVYMVYFAKSDLIFL